MHGNVQESLEKSLRDLDCEYVDLYLMHWPQATKTGMVHLEIRYRGGR